MMWISSYRGQVIIDSPVVWVTCGTGCAEGRHGRPPDRVPAGFSSRMQACQPVLNSGVRRKDGAWHILKACHSWIKKTAKKRKTSSPAHINQKGAQARNTPGLNILLSTPPSMSK